MSERVLVTGATGFLGGAVVADLASRGYTVVASGRDRRRGEALARQTGARFVAADLGRAVDVDRIVAGVDAIVHSGALASPWGRARDFERANVRGTVHIVDAAERAGVRRLVHISTPTLYFDYRDHLDVAEDHPIGAPVNDYVRTKIAAERVVLSARTRGMRATILRPRALFGPGDRNILPRVIRGLERGVFPIFGEGRNLVDLTYIDDAAQAVRLALVRAGSGTYNITSGEPRRLSDLLGQLAHALGVRPPRIRISYANALRIARGLEVTHALLAPDREPLLTRYTVGLLATTLTLDLSAARRDLDYQPLVGVDEGVRRFLAHHRGRHSENWRSS